MSSLSGPPGTRRTGRRRVRLAGRDDDPALRRRLREGTMDGSIRLSLEREPSYFASLDLEAERHDTVVLEDPADGEEEDGILAMGARLVHPVSIAGRPAHLGYLNHFRVAPGRRVALGALREGWNRLLDQRQDGESAFDLTSVAAGNRAARRLLERGLPGLPRYHPVGEYEVLAIPTGGRGPRGRRGRVEIREEGTEALLEDEPAALSLRWRGAGVVGPQASCIRLEARKGGRPVARLSVVDPTPWRQYVIRGYGGALARCRPLVNLGMRVLGAPVLPPPGAHLRSGFITGAVCRPGQEDALVPLVQAAARRARQEGMATLLLGGMVGDRWSERLASAYRPRRYRTVLYLVAREAPGPVLQALRSGPLVLDPVIL